MNRRLTLSMLPPLSKIRNQIYLDRCDDVIAAYDRGELSHVQYQDLADAAAQGMRREDVHKQTEQ